MRYLIAAALVSLVLWTAGCSTNSPTTTVSETTTSQGRTSQAPAGSAAAEEGNVLVRFINADPDGKGMDIVLAGELVFGNVAYKTTAPYKEIPKVSGELQFQLRETGGTEILGTNRRSLLLGRHYTLVALPQKNHTARLALTTDNLFQVEPGKARVRLINATPDVEDLDLYIAGTKSMIQHGVDASVVTSFTDVDEGTLEIRPVNRPAPPQLSNLKVEADRLYTFVVVGTSGGLELVRIEDRIEQ
jgi:hypothetical protein